MPIYEYECAKCGGTLDVLQKMDDPAPEKCAQCGAEASMSRMVSRTSFVLKGGGWYKDLYSSAKKDAKPAAESAPSAPAAASSSTTSSGSSSSGSGGGSSSTTSTAAAAAPTK